MERNGTPARAQELSQVRSSLASDGFSAVVVTGEPGIGKTTLWRAAVDHEEKLGRTVLIARPSEAESRLSYAALSDLLGPRVADLGSRLPPPQARALRVALRLEEPGARAVDQHSVAAGALGLIRMVCETGPLLLAVDDLQWLDIESAGALEYVVRRASDLPVHVLLSGRTGVDLPVTAALRSELDPEHLLDLHLGPMSIDDVHALLLANTGSVPSQPVLSRITEQSRGNPLHALELAARSAASHAPDDTSVPPWSSHGLVDALRARHVRLPEPTRFLLAAAAMTARPGVDVLSAAGFGDVVTVIEPAEDAGLASVDGAVVRFSHPLYADVAIACCTSAQRRSVHHRLSEVVPDPEERARHLAEAVVGDDAMAAAAAEDAAGYARLRGAPDAASDLAQLAVDRTPGADGGVLARRRLLLGELLIAAGDTTAALRVLERAADGGDPDIRVRALLLLARLASRMGPAADSVAIAEQAVLAARGRQIEVEAQIELALLSAPAPAQGLAHARRALELAEQACPADSEELARARLAMMDCQSSQGLPLDQELARTIPGPASDGSQRRVMDRVGYRLGNVLLTYDDMPRTRDALEASLAVIDAEGDEGSRPTVLDELAQLEIIAGRWALARAYATSELDHALRASQLKCRAAAWENLASIDVREGNDAHARTRLEDALAWSRGNDDTWEEAYALRTLGLLLLTQGDAAGATDVLLRVQRACEAAGVLSPGVLRHHGDLIEALCLSGRPDQALELGTSTDERGATSGSPLTRAAAHRGLALTWGHLGDLDLALSFGTGACAWGRSAEAPLELGRSLLTLGQVHRRRREKQHARTALTEAAGIFASLGAAPWSRRAAEELARLGLRAETVTSLTATEEAVAALAATGASNPEIASQLHMSRKTVEFHLTKVFRKLDVRSRTELAARWSTVHADAAPSAPPESTF